GHVILDELGGSLFGVAADLSDHHDSRSVRIGFECLQGVDMRRTDDGVTADTDCGGEPDIAQLEHHLIAQRTYLGNQAYRSRTCDHSRCDTSKRFSWCDDTGTTGSDDARVRTLRVREEIGGVLYRDPLGDDHQQTDTRVNGLYRRVLGECRRH